MVSKAINTKTTQCFKYQYYHMGICVLQYIYTDNEICNEILQLRLIDDILMTV